MNVVRKPFNKAKEVVLGLRSDDVGDSDKIRWTALLKVEVYRLLTRHLDSRIGKISPAGKTSNYYVYFRIPRSIARLATHSEWGERFRSQLRASIEVLPRPRAIRDLFSLLLKFMG